MQLAEVKKKPYKSKTLWANLIVAAVAFFPFVRDYVTPDQILIGLSGLNIVLRLITKDKIGFED